MDKSPLMSNRLRGAAQEIRKRLSRARATWSQYRRINVFCVGAMKTGTNFLAQCFERNYATEHEPNYRELIPLIIHQDSQLVERWLTQFQKNKVLEVNASHLNVFLVEQLLQLPNEPRFIMTVREPESWLNSLIGHFASYNEDPHWIEFRRHFFSRKSNVVPVQEKRLHQLFPFSLVRSLEYWRLCVERVIERVPPDQLLVIETSDLFKCANKLSSFLNIKQDTLCVPTKKVFEAKVRINCRDFVDSNYLESLIDQFCSPTIEKYYLFVNKVNSSSKGFGDKCSSKGFGDK